LSICEFNQCFRIAIIAPINEFLLLHLDHLLSVGSKMRAVKWLQDEEIFLKRVLGFHSCHLLDSFLPHSHKLPLFELLKEVQLFDVIV
jgi:hypothetical protein